MKYKYSQYNIIVNDDNYHLIYNTKSGYMIQLDNENFNIFNHIENIIEEDSLNQLINLGLIVSEETDELLELNHNHKIAKYNTNDLALTIQTTNYCNFSCPYCYQNPNEIKLNEESLNALKLFIEMKIKEGVNNIRIHWFGGEPLLNLSAILSFETFLNKLKNENSNLTVNNSLTTNGYYLKKDSFIKIMESTSISNIQITLDGPEPIHNMTRKLKNNNIGTFNILLDNIKECLSVSKDITFTLRTNLNMGNIDYVINYLDTLKQANILYNENIFINFQQTHNFNNQSDG